MMEKLVMSGIVFMDKHRHEHPFFEKCYKLVAKMNKQHSRRLVRNLMLDEMITIKKSELKVELNKLKGQE